MAGFELYPDADGEWRWRVVAGNNVDIVANGGEGYHNRADCLRGARAALKGLLAEFIDETVDRIIGEAGWSAMRDIPNGPVDTPEWLDPRLDPGEAERLRNMFPPS